jgi:hypothetical protein
MPWYVTIKIPDHGNSWTFRFPLKRESAVDGGEIYKIDGMPTWIFPNGETVDSMSEEETPYTILRKVLKSPPGGTPLHFNFPASTLGTNVIAPSQRNRRKENLMPRSSMLPSTVMGLISLKVRKMRLIVSSGCCEKWD